MLQYCNKISFFKNVKSGSNRIRKKAVSSRHELFDAFDETSYSSVETAGTSDGRHWTRLHPFLTPSHFNCMPPLDGANNLDTKTTVGYGPRCFRSLRKVNASCLELQMMKPRAPPLSYLVPCAHHARPHVLPPCTAHCLHCLSNVCFPV